MFVVNSCVSLQSAWCSLCQCDYWSCGHCFGTQVSCYGNFCGSCEQTDEMKVSLILTPDSVPTLQRLPPIVSRFVPFAAVAAANCINIPFMRQR